MANMITKSEIRMTYELPSFSCSMVASVLVRKANHDCSKASVDTPSMRQNVVIRPSDRHVIDHKASISTSALNKAVGSVVPYCELHVLLGGGEGRETLDPSRRSLHCLRIRSFQGFVRLR